MASFVSTIKSYLPSRDTAVEGERNYSTLTGVAVAIGGVGMIYLGDDWKKIAIEYGIDAALHIWRGRITNDSHWANKAACLVAQMWRIDNIFEHATAHDSLIPYFLNKADNVNHYLSSISLTSLLIGEAKKRVRGVAY